MSQPVDRGFATRNEASRGRLVRLLDRLSDADAADALDTHLATLPDDRIAAVLAAGIPRMVDRSLHRDGHMGPIETALFG